MKKMALVFSLLLSFQLILARPIQATEGSVLGIHILNPGDLSEAKELLKTEKTKDEWHYVTIPLSLDDLNKHDEWNEFFKVAKQEKFTPIVRLVTRFQNGTWKVPNKKEITNYFTFLNTLDWPTDKKYIIVFNEVNHANEWGGTINPSEYTDVLRFTSNWAKSEDKNYQILPAAMDLAAPNGGQTMEAFNYLEQMRQSDPDIFQYLDYWNSHSYPNPGFSSAPTRTEKNSLNGFKHELSYLKEKTGREYQTFITETGWADNAQTHSHLANYYDYATAQVWSDPRIIAVTPFILKGAPGPFAQFTFLDRNDQPTNQYRAYQQAMDKFDLKLQ
jgi:hypothetical protein